MRASRLTHVDSNIAMNKFRQLDHSSEVPTTLVPIYSGGQMEWYLQYQLEQVNSYATERDEIKQQELKKVLSKILDQI